MTLPTIRLYPQSGSDEQNLLGFISFSLLTDDDDVNNWVHFNQPSNHLAVDPTSTNPHAHSTSACSQARKE